MTVAMYAKIIGLCLMVSIGVTVAFAATYYGREFKTQDAHRVEVYLWRDTAAKCYTDYTKLLGDAQTLNGKYQELLKGKGEGQ